jgi:tetratricopeptide (TPR) repeat protein/transglutaminase-like putative cysteine protease
LAALLAVVSPTADASSGPIHREVLKAAQAVSAARGPDVYAALRELWRTWDRADPAHVEEAITTVASDKATPAPARVYAELLSAYSRRRRGDLDGSLAKIAKLGFIGKWIAVGPFENDNKAGFPRAFAPEAEINEPVILTRAYDGKDHPVKWRVPPETPQYGWFDFGDILRPRENVCGYATTFIRAKAGTRTPRAISLWMGAAGAFRVFWNGELVLEDSGYRDLDVDRFATTVKLGPGDSRILVKVCGDTDAPKFALRIADEHGAPDLGVEAVVDVPTPAASKGAGPAGPTADKTKPPTKTEAPGAPGKGDKSPSKDPPSPQLRPPGPLLGPVQQFERLTSGGKPPAAVLESYARYLAITGGDSKPEHKARDLARRAAEAEPTVRRLLLAGQLAEDKNQQREWVDRAAALAGGPRHRDIEVLLAQAQLARNSVNWRDAVPIYQRLLSIEPGNAAGILGLADLYVEAGLKRTALVTLEQAVTDQPTSVALLRAYAVQLRALGRDTEASEVEARYAALRFDDSGFLSQQVELAVARRDRAGAERWLDRFIRSEPDGAFARTVAARTYRALGQPDRAKAAYQRALAMAPEDIQTLRALSDLYGEEGKRDEQLKLLREILAIHPQAKDVREYVEHIEPPKPRSDEAYAWGPERFLPLRAGSAQRYTKRTLRSLTVTTVFPNGLASRFRQVVFQPLTDEAAAAARQYAFEYQGDRQTVNLRAAKVYRADGKVDEAIESGEGGANNPALAMYTSQRAFYVNFPRLNAGDIVELRYRIEDVALRNEIADYFGEMEYLQSDEPIGSSEYVLITPKKRTFHTFVSPLPGLKREISEKGDYRIYRFAAADVAPLLPEAAMPPYSEVVAHVHVSTFKTWNEVGSWYWGLARDQFDVDDEVRRVAKEITKGLTDARSKVRAVYKYATGLRYVALEFGIEGIRPRRCAQTLARGWGDCKDKATLIVTLLRELGIPSTIVLVRTRLRGDVEAEPASLAPFDHAIAYVPSLDLYLDGTAEHTGSTELPSFDRGAVALQINEGKPKLVRLPQPPPEESVLRRRIEITVTPDGSAQFGADAQVSGAFAAAWRNRYLAEGTRRDRATRDFLPDLGSVDLAQGKAGVDVNDLEDVEQPVKLRAHGKAPTFGRREGESLSLPSGPLQRLVPEYAPASTRRLDVQLNALTTREDEWVIRIPQGMKVTAAPAPDKKDTPYGRYEITVEQAPAKITVKSSLAFKKARIPPAEYAAWRAFCDSVDRAFGQRIIVSK